MWPGNMFHVCWLVKRGKESKRKKKKEKNTLFFVSLTLFNILLVFVCLEGFLFHLLHLNPQKAKKTLIHDSFLRIFIELPRTYMFENLKWGHHTLTLT